MLESHAIEETSEWRSFSDSDKANRSDPNRVGGPSNPLLNSGGLGTSVAKGNDAQSHAYAPRDSRCAARALAFQRRARAQRLTLRPRRAQLGPHARAWPRPRPVRCAARARERRRKGASCVHSH